MVANARHKLIYTNNLKCTEVFTEKTVKKYSKMQQFWPLDIVTINEFFFSLLFLPLYFPHFL